MKPPIRILFYILLVLTVWTTHGHAQTPITQDIAVKYYNNCLSNTEKEGTMSKKSREAYCLCTAGQMKSAMTQEDLKDLAKKDQSARLALNKVLTDVNAPCTQYPLYDKVYNNCISKIAKHPQCHCLAKNISNYISGQSQLMMKDILARNPDAYDPLGEIMETQTYKDAEQKITMSCALNPNN